MTPSPKNSSRALAQNAPRNPLAIVGLSCMFPGARDLAGYWDLLRDGIDAIREVPETHWSPDDYWNEDRQATDQTYGRRGGFIDPVDFDPMEFGISPRDLDATDTSQLLSLAVAKAALDDAGYGEGGPRELPREKTSVILGVTGALELVVPLGARLGHPIWKRALADAGVSPEVAADVVERIRDQYPPWRESSFPGLLGNVAAGRIANRLNLLGTNCVVDAACASSMSALYMAALELESGRADVALAGGVDTFNDIFMYMCFSKTPALSPSGNARPFEAEGDGTTLGEGLGVLVLKRLADAERDGDRIYAVIRGIGSSSDGAGMAVYAPSDAGQARCLEAAYRDAGVSPATIELVEAHGTGTRVGDAVEARALDRVFRKASPEGTWVALGSAKSQIGHTKAAAGAAGLIKAVLALWHRVLPPTIKVDTPNDAVAPGSTPFYLNTVRRPWIPRLTDAETGGLEVLYPRRAGVSAFGFGGTNFHCVVEEAHHAAADWGGAPLLFAFCGQSVEDTRGKAQLLANELAEVTGSADEMRRFAARTRRSYDASQPVRLVVVAASADDAGEAFERAIAAGDDLGERSFLSLLGGTVWATGRRGRAAAVFPGQGAQAPGMLRDLACRFPVMQDALAEADFESMRAGGAERLSDLIYPHPAFDGETLAAQRAALQATDRAQPALGAVEYGAFLVLRSLGFEAAAFAGHSYGELVALAAAGRLESSELHRLSYLRGQLMASVGGDVGRDPGSMLAVLAEAPEVEGFLGRHQLDLVIANRNSPRQHVLSGATSEIERAASLLASEGLAGKQLAVAAAFHSSLVEAAAAPFTAALAAVSLGIGDQGTGTGGLVFANATANVYPDDPEAARELLGAQLARPVAWQGVLEAMAESGIDTFVEVGPGRRLSGLVDDTLGEAVVALAIDPAGDGAVAGLARAVAGLAARGVEIDLALWDPLPDPVSISPSKRRPFTVALSGANHREPVPPRPPRPAPAPEFPTPESPTPLPALAAPVSHPAGALSSFISPPDEPALSGLAEGDPMHEVLRSLLRLQETNAEIHRRFLDGQESISRQIERVLEQAADASSTAVAPPTAVAPRVAASSEPSRDARPGPVVSPAPAPVATPSQTPVPAVPGPLVQALFEAVSEKTGYPVEMLEPAMELDADLGIDSIKRVEILAALEERFPELPRLEAERLGGLRTLAEVVATLEEGAPQLAALEQPAHSPAVLSSAAAAVSDDLRAALFEAVSEKTGYPVAMLEPAMELDADLGIDSIKRVEILAALEERFPGLPRLEAERLGELRTLADVVGVLGGGTGAVSAAMPSVAAENSAPAENGAPAVPLAVEEPARVIASARAATSLETLSQALFDAIAEKTGYPADMLEPQMGLDADLGIDSIKRVEILAALEEKFPELPRLEAEQLGALRSVEEVLAALATGLAAADVAAAPDASGPPAAQEGLAAADSEAIERALYEAVAQKTGYPIEMLEPQMGLDADLGIDSIKRVEILAALEERFPALPRLDADDLGRLRTLADVAEAITQPAAEASPAGSREPNLGPEPAPPVQAGPLANAGVPAPAVAPEPVAVASRTVATGEALPRFVSFVDEGVPAAGDSPPLLPPGALVWVTEAGDGVAQALASELEALGFHAEVVDPRALPSPPAILDGLLLLAPDRSEAAHDWLWEAFSTVQHAASAFRRQADGSERPLIAAVTRQGGAFGFEAPAEGGIVSSAIAGLIRTVAREWPEVTTRVVDVEAAELENGVARLARALVQIGPPEIGLQRERTLRLGVRPTPLPSAALLNGHARSFTAEDFLVISGGARGVTAECAVALAAAGVGRLALLGRSPLPASDDAFSGVADSDLERAVLDAALAAGEKLKPRELTLRCQKVRARREIETTLSRVRAAGAEASYLSVDVRDAQATAGVILALETEHGAVTGLVHGAGVLRDAAIEEKTEADWRTVYDTKVRGLENLLASLAHRELSWLALFSSSTGRFGRRGQVDYAVANAALDSHALAFAQRHPEARAVSVGWGPWDGGMVDASLKNLFRAEGVEVVPLAEGGRQLVRELLEAPRDQTLVVILGAGSNLEGLVDEPPEEPATTGTRAVASRVATPPAGSEITISEQTMRLASTGSEAAEQRWQTAFGRLVSLESHPFLASHVMNGRAVLPAAMMVEWLAHGALHGQPGLRFFGVDDLRVWKGVRVAHEEITVRIEAGSSRWEREGDTATLLVPVRMISDGSNGEAVLHCGADIVLTERLPKAPAAGPRPESGEPIDRSLDQIYDELLFHGPALHGLTSIEGWSGAGIVGRTRTAEAPAQWMQSPIRASWIADPLALDVAFQLMIVWSRNHSERGSLPARLPCYRQYVRSLRGGELEVTARVREAGERIARADLEWLRDGQVVARLDGYECVIDAALNGAFARNRIDSLPMTRRRPIRPGESPTR